MSRPRSGWFSERTARYLASGRPALVQDTGFSRTLPVGEGLLAFRTLEDAVGRRAHGSQRTTRATGVAARRIAEEYFDSDKILARLLEDADMSRAICVLGMMRTGTSAVAGMLELLGVHFGPEEHLLEPNVANPDRVSRAPGASST